MTVWSKTRVKFKSHALELTDQPETNGQRLADKINYIGHCIQWGAEIWAPPGLIVCYNESVCD